MLLNIWRLLSFLCRFTFLMAQSIWFFEIDINLDDLKLTYRTIDTEQTKLYIESINPICIEISC